jgi:hypothetical protein
MATLAAVVIVLGMVQVCEIFAWTSTVRSSDGVILATLTYVATTYTYTFADSNIWGQQIELELIDGTGIIEGTTVDGDADCGPPTPEKRCDVAMLDFPEQRFEIGSRAAGNAFYESVDLALVTSVVKSHGSLPTSTIPTGKLQA